MNELNVNVDLLDIKTLQSLLTTARSSYTSAVYAIYGIKSSLDMLSPDQKTGKVREKTSPNYLRKTEDVYNDAVNNQIKELELKEKEISYLESLISLVENKDGVK